MSKSRIFRRRNQQTAGSNPNSRNIFKRQLDKAEPFSGLPIVIKSDGLTNLLAIIIPVLLLPGLYFILYAYPWISGVLLFVSGITLLILVSRVKKNYPDKTLRRFHIFLPVILMLAGFFLFFFSNAIRSVFLDNIYGTTLGPRRRFHQFIETKSKRFGDSIWPINLSRLNHKIDMNLSKSSESLTNLFISSEGRLFFLTGSAGTGKTPLLSQWALLLQKKFDDVFFVSLRDQEESLRQSPKLPELVAHAYRDVIDSSQYYKILFETKPCLVILDDLDEIDSDSANHVMKAAYDLVSQTPTKVIIGSRPEKVWSSDYYKRDLRNANDSLILTIEPIAEKHFEYFIQRLKNQESNFDKALSILKSKPLVGKMAVELDHLDKIVELAHEFENKSEFEIIEKLVSERVKRNIQSHWSRAGIDPVGRMREIGEIAFQMSNQNTNQTDDSRLEISGFITVDPGSGKYMFSPRILQSYFALKVLQQRLEKRERVGIFSKMLLDDLTNFPSLQSQIMPHIMRSFKESPNQYKDSIDSLLKLKSDKRSVTTVLNGLSKGELINNFILKQK